MSRLSVVGLCCRDLGPFDFQVESHECVVLTGPSGSGKTLLLRALADLDEHEGQIMLNGVESTSIPAPDWRKQVALLPPEPRWWRETVGEHFRDTDGQTIEALGFDHTVMSWEVRRLSTGESQRLALARLLDGKPGVLLLDEPTANLDAGNQERVEALVAGYRAERAAAVLWVTHDPEQARRVSSRRLTLVDGRFSLE